VSGTGVAGEGTTGARVATVADRGWEALARASASGRERSEEPEVLRELLSFLLAGTPYALPVERVREIVRLRKITPMPRVPPDILGVISLRGEIVQVLDLRMRLGLECSEPARVSRVIVLHGDDEKVTGVLVDAVREVLRVSEDEIRPASSGEGDSVSELCVRGEEFISILELDRVLDIHAIQ
jgi:chemotaxis signal transduction protein